MEKSFITWGSDGTKVCSAVLGDRKKSNQCQLICGFVFVYCNSLVFSNHAAHLV